MHAITDNANVRIFLSLAISFLRICYQYRVTGSISAFAPPASVTSSNNNPTSGTNITLTQAGGNILLGNFRWYIGSCGGTFLGTGASINVTVVLYL